MAEPLLLTSARCSLAPALHRGDTQLTMTPIKDTFPVMSGYSYNTGHCIPSEEYPSGFRWPRKACNALHRRRKGSGSAACKGVPFQRPAEKARGQQRRVKALMTVGFPESYEEVLEQARTAAQAALSSGHKLLEIEFPTASLDSTAGDGEGGIEMTNSMVYMHEFCRLFGRTGQASTTRIFFPDVREVGSARTTVFGGSPFRLGFLTQPGAFDDLGISQKARMASKVAPDDQIFVIAYPYFNVNEMLAVEELHRDVAEAGGQPIILFNGELDRIRSGYYPPFFYPKLAQLNRNFLPKFETAYYIHNFKGRLGGKLFRRYPGPWQILREDANGQLVCVEERAAMPSLKEVALDVLPRFAR